MARVDYTTDPETDSRLNPAKQAKSAGSDSGSELSDREEGVTNDLKSQFDNKDSDLNPNQNDSASAAVNNQESSVPNNGFYQPSNDKKRNNLKSTLKLAKKSRGIIAIVGILLSLAATFSALKIKFSTRQYRPTDRKCCSLFSRRTFAIYNHTLVGYESYERGLPWR